MNSCLWLSVVKDEKNECLRNVGVVIWQHEEYFGDGTLLCFGSGWEYPNLHMIKLHRTKYTHTNTNKYK